MRKKRKHHVEYFSCGFFFSVAGKQKNVICHFYNDQFASLQLLYVFFP
jgi:hypothetical protein